MQTSGLTGVCNSLTKMMQSDAWKPIRLHHSFLLKYTYK